MLLYAQEKIAKECSIASHKILTTDTQRLKNFELQEELRFLERKLYKEAKALKIDLMAMQKDIANEQN